MKGVSMVSFIKAILNSSKYLLSLFFILYIACVCFLLWKCQYGYGNLDESFYLTIPYRLAQGDGLLIHEWHLSQLSGFLLLPIMRVYLWLFSSTDGIILHFRWVFTVCWSLAAIFYFFRLRKFSIIGAACASLAFLIFAPRGIMALSYNSLGVMLLLNAAIIPTTVQKYKRFQYTVAGLCYAGAVLCSPFLVVLYAVLTTASIIVYAKTKDKKIIKQWFYFSLGCLILFILFCITVFSHCSLSDLSSAFPWIMSDPDHPHKPIWRIVAIYFYKILFSHPISIYLFILGALFIFAGIKWDKMKLPGFLGMCLLSIIYLLAFQLTKRDPDYLMLPITMTGFYCAVTSKQKSIRRIFYGIWIPGALYSYFICMSSNQWFYSISLALTVSCVASIVIISIYVKELINEQHCKQIRFLSITFASILLIVQICSELDLRYSFLYWEPSMTIQTELLDIGPEKGLLVSESRKKEYELLIEKLKPMKEDDQINNALLITRSAVAYLYIEKESSAYSAWLGLIAARPGLENVDSYNIEKIDAYFDINPNKIPDVVFIDDGEDVNSEYAAYLLSKGYVQSVETGYYFRN